jgi:endonuclease YncB( thermonuclease family)
MSEQLTIEIQMPQRPVRYWYKVRTDCIRVIDGDTIECLTDLTHGVYTQATYRLASINAPEMKGKTLRAAKLAALHLRGLIENENYLWLKSLKNRGNDKQIQTFGRYVAYVFTEFGDCLNVQMVAEGHAVPYMIELITEDSFEVKK